MYCMNCGTENSTNSRFCTGCGRLLRAGNTQTAGYNSERGRDAVNYFRGTTATTKTVGGTTKNPSLVGGTVLTIVGVVLAVLCGMIYNQISRALIFGFGFMDSGDRIVVGLIVLGIFVGIALAILGAVILIRRLVSRR